MEEEVTHGLPRVIVEEILALLPMESISRFRLVSKEWSSFLVSPEFGNLRSKLLVPPRSSGGSTPQRFLLSRPSGLYFIDYAGVLEEANHFLLSYISPPPPPFEPAEDECAEGEDEGGDDDDDYDVEEDGSESEDGEDYCNSGIELYFPPRERGGYDRVKLIGSCNGLVCVSLEWRGYDHLVVWNPCTGIYRELPRPKSASEPHRYYIWGYGFGFDSASQDFKILLSGGWTDHGKCKTRIFSLKANSWKEISCHRDVYGDEPEGLFLNGAFHWYNADDKPLLAFNLEKEEFYEVPLPAPDVDRYRSEDDAPLRIAGTGGQYLCLTWINQMIQRVQFWVMMEYGVQASWVLLFNLPDERQGPVYYKCEDELMRRFLNNYGHVCMQRGSSHRETIDFNVAGVDGKQGFFIHTTLHTIPYTEDVTSPFSFSETL